MHRILRNRFISNLRQRRDTIDIDDIPSSALATEAPHENRLVLKYLGEAITRLPADQREALIMVVVQGMSYEALAEPPVALLASPRGVSTAHVANSRRG